MKMSNRCVNPTVLLILSSLCFTACGGGDSGSNTAQGGSSSAGGSTSSSGGQTSTGGGTSASGSLAAAMSLNFLSGGVNCPMPVGYEDFPSVAGGHPVTGAGVTATTPNNVTSPRGLVTVECSIGGSVLQGSITLGGGAVSMALGVRRSGTTSGNLLYTPLNSSETYGATSAAPCTITPISTTATGGLYSVSCTSLTANDGTSCVLGQSYVYFEGCTVQ